MSQRILIIEDNPANLELITYLIEQFGYSVLTATDGASGLALIKQERPDLILCDIQMPNLDGFAVAKAVKSDPELRLIPIVAVTALAMVGDREKGLAGGFDGYIFKPINPQVFAEQMSAFLRLGKEVKMQAMKPSQHSMMPLPSKRRVILSVDDQAVNIKLMECLFEPHGFTVTTAGGLSHALAVARQHRPDLILSDVKMLEGNGLDLCRAIKADPELKDIPVVLITSTFCDEKSRSQGLAIGAEKFLFRPIDPAVLLAEIEACLDKKEP